MLQQTQVDRVIEKYHAFLKRFPTVQKLARARTASVITQWAGLGYNRRALYLQKTAQAVVKEYGGQFPTDLEALKALPGIGDYTARALLSFAFEQPVPMMDTNHRKFYARVLSKGIILPDADLLERAEQLIAGLSGKQVHNWNQAIMDLMSAVARKERTEFVDTFDKTYPLKPIQKKKKKQIPFKETDRYVRGQIIAILREHKRISKKALRKHFHDLDEERMNRIVEKLLRDGLIKQVKQSIILP